MEVFIIAPAPGHRRWEPCAEAIKDPKLIRKGSIVVYMGVDEDPGGDPGGYRYLLCAQVQKRDIWVQGTEDRQESPTIKAIFTSFRFSK